MQGWAGAVIVAVLCGGLAGCSTDDSPAVPATRPAVTSTPEVTVTKPSLLLGQPTAASAVAFVRYFWDVYNYAYASYDTSLLQEISQPSCKYCSSVLEEINRLKTQGMRVEGSEVSLVDAVLPPDEPITDSAFVVTVSSQRPGKATSAAGRVTTVDGVKNSHVAFGLDWNGGKWLVRGVMIQKKGTPWRA